MMGMDVEVDLYSGRPNPHFRLDQAGAATLMRLLAALPPLSGHAAPRQTLGYRGLRIVSMTESPIAEIVVSGGVVFVRDRDGAEHLLKDPDRRLERWIVDAGAASLDPSTIAIVNEDLET
jgi:hypothetical protein